MVLGTYGDSQHQPVEVHWGSPSGALSSGSVSALGSGFVVGPGEPPASTLVVLEAQALTRRSGKRGSKERRRMRFRRHAPTPIQKPSQT